MKPYVYCYWVIQSETVTQSPVSYRIVTDGCVDFLINCKAFERLIIAGTAKTSEVVSFNGEVEYFGIRFLPGWFYSFFLLPLKQISNLMIPCQDIWGNLLDEFESKLFSAQSTKERINISESFILQQLIANIKFADMRFWNILEQIYQHNSDFIIEQNSTHGISPRQLRRLFDRYIGISPKTFSRIVRFQSVLQTMMKGPKKEWGKLCFDFGYYDQPHFLHEFKDFFGLPPMSVHSPQK